MPPDVDICQRLAGEKMTTKRREAALPVRIIDALRYQIEHDRARAQKRREWGAAKALLQAHLKLTHVKEYLQKQRPE